MSTVACIAFDTIPAPAPQPLQTPRPVPGHMTVDDAIALLRGAGLTVETVDGPSDVDAFSRSVDLTGISLNGYDRIGIAEYASPPTRDGLAYDFSMYADFAARNNPNLITVGNIVFLVLGTDEDPVTEILTAVWDMAPPAEIMPFGATSFSFDNSAEDTEKRIGNWLDGRDDTKGLAPAGQAPVLTTMSSFAGAWGFDALVDNLPHPDSQVWVTEFREPGEDRFVTIASELISGIPVAEVKTKTTLGLDALSPVEPR